MLDLHLDDAEQRVLRDVLESAISDLAQEIHHTDSMDYRDALKERRRVLQKVVDSLAGPGL